MSLQARLPLGRRAFCLGPTVDGGGGRFCPHCLLGCTGACRHVGHERAHHRDLGGGGHGTRARRVRHGACDLRSFGGRRGAVLRPLHLRRELGASGEPPESRACSAERAGDGRARLDHLSVHHGAHAHLESAVACRRWVRRGECSVGPQLGRPVPHGAHDRCRRDRRFAAQYVFRRGGRLGAQAHGARGSAHRRSRQLRALAYLSYV